MNLIALPAFSDNCIWMFHDGRRAVVVDPGESAPVLKALDSQELQPAAILVTRRRVVLDDCTATLREWKNQIR